MKLPLQPLPVRATQQHYEKQARALLSSFQAGDARAIRWIRQHHPRLPGRADTNDRNIVTVADIRRTKISAADARTIVARWHGFDDWAALIKHLAAMVAKDSAVLAFERAVEAVVTGDTATLRSLLKKYPNLIRARSTRQHHATLLHYVSANGVEDYHQVTPPNAPRIARILLGAGAEVDADLQYDPAVYGERVGSTTLGLVATSYHPAAAGVQEELLRILLAAGASIDGLVGGWNPLIAALHNGRGQAAQFLARQGAKLDLEGAIGTGSLQRTKEFFSSKGDLKEGASERQLQAGFMWACQYGHRAVVKFLLEQGFPVDARPRGETGLHWAAYSGDSQLVKLLLKQGASIDIVDRTHHGTPLGWALYGWAHPAPEKKRANYYEVVGKLVAAGATLDINWCSQRGLNKKWKVDAKMRMALRETKLLAPGRKGRVQGLK